MSRVAHTYPNPCAAPGCQTLMDEGLLLCSVCWRRLPEKMRHRLLITMECWKGGGSVQPYTEAREAAVDWLSLPLELTQTYGSPCCNSMSESHHPNCPEVVN